jgi:hypothetical protein
LRSTNPLVPLVAFGTTDYPADASMQASDNIFSIMLLLSLTLWFFLLRAVIRGWRRSGYRAMSTHQINRLQVDILEELEKFDTRQGSRQQESGRTYMDRPAIVQETNHRRHDVATALEELGRGGFIESPRSAVRKRVRYGEWSPSKITDSGQARLRKMKERVSPVSIEINNSQIGNGNTQYNVQAKSINNSFNQIKNSGISQDQVAALSNLIKLVEGSGSAEAVDVLNTFLEQLQKDSSKKTILSSLLSTLERVLPVLSEMSGLLGKVHSIFA